MNRRRPPTTVPRRKPPRTAERPPAPRGAFHPPPPRGPRRPKRPTGGGRVAHIVTDSETSLLDVLDNLLSKGVVLNADLVLALANVDLVYVRLSALLVAADRLLQARDAY